MLIKKIKFNVEQQHGKRAHCLGIKCVENENASNSSELNQQQEKMFENKK